MQLAFSWWQLFDVLLSILWLISGIRDFMGKDPLIRLPFNQYERDPEYRAFWQKKNGVFYMLNSIAFLILTFIPVTSLIYRIIFGIAIVGDLLYLVAYEAWEHSDDREGSKNPDGQFILVLVFPPPYGIMVEKGGAFYAVGFFLVAAL